jgi:hypothetical protein
MAGRRTEVFVLLFLVLVPVFLSGQTPEEAEKFFYIERIGGEDRFIQRLTWEETEHVYRYEITVERQDGSGEYAEIFREFRTENFIELSLDPGLYRYRIGVYNLLNRPAGISSWFPFRVFPAFQPELYSFSQDFLSAKTGDSRMEITLQGANLVKGAELRMQSESGGGDIVPLAFFPEGESARLVFAQLAPGPYRVWIRNPGGLEAFLDITVAPALNFRGIYVSAEYAPMVPLYGYLFSPFDRAFYPAGVSLRAGFMPIVRSWGELGLELAPSWNMLDSDMAKVNTGTVHLNGLYQWFFADTAALVLRAGAGINLIHGKEDHDSASIFTWTFSAGGGIFLRWFIPDTTLYLEAGVEYNHLFTSDPPAGYIKPALGFGARF